MLAVDDIPCAMMVTDLQGGLRRVNAELLRIVGGTQDGWHGRAIDELLSKPGRMFVQTHVFPMLHDARRVREVYLHLLGADGQLVPVMLNATTKTVGAESLVLWALFVARERSRFESELIKARRDAESLAARLVDSNQQVERLNRELAEHAQRVEQDNRQLSVLSLTDPLTGLRNRRALELAVRAWQAQATTADPVSLLLVDVDHFKRINDSCGHPEGDRVLVALARQLRASARSSDLVVRLGGEEFVLWLPYTDAPCARRVAGRLHEGVAELVTPLGGVTVSVGLVSGTWSPAASLLSLLLGLADKAVYEAKALGRNRTAIVEAPELVAGDGAEADGDTAPAGPAFVGALR